MNTDPFDLNSLKSHANLSPEEKLESFSTIEKFMISNPIPEPIISPYISWILGQKSFALTATILLTLTGVSFASEYATPGNILYPIKINVNEKVAESFVFSDLSKARFHISLASKRIEEIEKAQESEKISANELRIASASLAKHSKQAEDSIKKEKVLDLSSELEAALSSYNSSSSATTSTSSERSNQVLTEIEETISNRKASIRDYIKAKASSTKDTKPEKKEGRVENETEPRTVEVKVGVENLDL